MTKSTWLNYKKGWNYHILYDRWDKMMRRCLHESHEYYPHYGGRGITVEQYLQDFDNYVEYVESLPNYDPKLTVDRINNDGNYERGNLRWVTQAVNNLNRKQNSKEHMAKITALAAQKRRNFH